MIDMGKHDYTKRRKDELAGFVGPPAPSIPWHERRWSRPMVEEALHSFGLDLASLEGAARFPRAVAPDEWLASEIVLFTAGEYQPESPPYTGPKFSYPLPHEGPTQLYRHFDDEGRLLYVGISLSAITRLAQHRSASHWSRAIVRVEIEHFDTRREALMAEAKAIIEERPLHNIAGVE
jgi:hypothetical protein